MDRDYSSWLDEPRPTWPPERGHQPPAHRRSSGIDQQTLLAGAAVLGPSEEVGISQVSWGADGDFTTAIYQDKDFGTYFDEVHAFRDDTTTEAPVRPFLRMEGRKVFRWAATALLPACQEALKLAGLTSTDIDVFVPHQANLRITQVLIKALELRDDCVIAEDIVTTGNTSAASIPASAMAPVVAATSAVHQSSGSCSARAPGANRVS